MALPLSLIVISPAHKHLSTPTDLYPHPWPESPWLYP